MKFVLVCPWESYILPAEFTPWGTKYLQQRTKSRMQCVGRHSALEREKGFEPSVLCLGSKCFTTKLLPRVPDYTKKHRSISSLGCVLHGLFEDPHPPNPHPPNPLPRGEGGP